MRTQWRNTTAGERIEAIAYRGSSTRYQTGAKWGENNAEKQLMSACPYFSLFEKVMVSSARVASFSPFHLENIWHNKRFANSNFLLDFAFAVAQKRKKKELATANGNEKKRKEKKSAQVICCSLIGPNPPGPVPRVHSTTNEPRKRKEKRRRRRRRFSHPKEYKKEKRIWGNYYRRYYAQFSESNF